MKQSRLQQYSCCALHSLRFMSNVLLVMLLLLLLLAYKPPSRLSHAALYTRQHQAESSVRVCFAKHDLFIVSLLFEKLTPNTEWSCFLHLAADRVN